jgi:hypothetical protein
MCAAPLIYPFFHQEISIPANLAGFRFANKKTQFYKRMGSFLLIKGCFRIDRCFLHKIPLAS